MLSSELQFAGISMAPLTAAAGALLAAGFLHILAAAATRRWNRSVDPKEPDHERRARTWLVHAAQEARPPMAVLVWTYAVHFALSQMTGEVTGELIADEATQASIGRAIDWARGLITVCALFWLLLRVGRYIEVRLTGFSRKTENKADDILLPLAGKAVRLILPLIALVLGVPALEISPETRALLGDATSLLIIATVAFLLFQTVDALQAFIVMQYRIDVQDNYRARGVHTQVLMLKRVAVVVISVITLASMLMVFDSVRRFGTTILASAGVAGIVIGFAAQRSIATLLAGFQIALTQPIRIDDVVIVENEWGRIEEITLTYVVVNIWDMRRLILPITYFIEKPFQNWTRTNSQIMGSVFLYVDYDVPIDHLRTEYERILKNEPLWDGHAQVLQVTDFKERCMELRGLMTASDAARAWDLRCAVREKLLAWLSANYPQALPRARVQLKPQTATAEIESADGSTHARATKLTALDGSREEGAESRAERRHTQR